MGRFVYFIDCLTNLHVGSGDENYSIVDKQVERDPVNGNPIIHASGIKGALRDIMDERNKDEAERIFGKPCKKDSRDDSGGLYHFCDARLLYRPLRCSNGTIPSIHTTTEAMLNDYIDFSEAFGLKTGLMPIEAQAFGENEFLATANGVCVEAEKTGRLSDAIKDRYKVILGEDFAIAKSLDDYDLPVIARNNLGEHRNLWYEEYVPHGSRFYMLILTPDGEDADRLFPEDHIVQIGGNASVGYGYCRFTLVGSAGKGVVPHE